MSSSSRTTAILLACFALAPDCRISHALSTAATSGITIALPGNKVEKLPNIYVNTFRRWVVEHEDGEMTGGKCEPVAGAGMSLVDEGWVSPTSTADLWWPRDIEKIQARPAVNVLFRSGVLSYTSVGLDVRVPQQLKTGEQKTWRNWGMNSQPIARLWNTFDILLEKMFHVEGFMIDNSGKIEELFPNSRIQTVMERVASFVAEVDSLSPIAEGFHVVSFPIQSTWSDLPAPKLCDSSNGKDEAAEIQKEPPQYKIVLLGTSEPFGKKLLMEPDSVLEMSSTSVLEIAVFQTEEGKSSQYLPEPYKELYLSK
mmetsp:Transcript_24857/g.59014  ORF Transcript_24857/g.59014 Transcript_24857/m.59014 type:complete len:312 (-) Transcript_24857:129-1064(-)